MALNHPPVLRQDAPPPAPPLGGWGADASDQSEPAGLDWARVLSALRRFKWLAAVVTLLGTAAGVVATRMVSPVYVAQATIMIDAEERASPERARGPIQAGELVNAQAWVDLVESYLVLDQVARDLRLFAVPASPSDAATLAQFATAESFRSGDYRLTVDADGRRYLLVDGDGRELERGAVGDSVGRTLGFQWAPEPRLLTPGQTVAFTVSTPRDAARQLADALVTRMDLNANFLRLELQGASPQRVAATVNAVANRFVKVAAELKREKLSELTRSLGAQLEFAHGSLVASEAALRQFRVRTITLPSEPLSGTAGAGAAPAGQVDPAVTAFMGVQSELEEVRRDRTALERLIQNSGPDGLQVGVLEMLGSVKRSPGITSAMAELTAKRDSLRNLRYRYAEAYPPLQRLTSEITELERQTIPTMVRGLVAELAARESELERRVSGTARELRQIPQRALEEQRLRRALLLAENLYTTLRTRYEEARVAEASSIPDVRILDAASVPREPLRDPTPRLIALAFLGSLGIAVVGAVLIDRLDPRVRYPEQVSQELGLPILGAVPHLPAGLAAGPLSPDKVHEVVEAFRAISLGVRHAYGAGPCVLSITSPGVGDGKSFISANLALAFASSGYRTLLIDADLRRGAVHRRVGAQRKPGLADYLQGSVAREWLVQTTAYSSLWFIGCGGRTSAASQLLAKGGMAEYLGELRQHYDVILVDCPPLGAAVDPFILSTLTGNVLVVLRTGTSHRALAAAKLEALRRLPVRLLGAVLNDVPPVSVYRYYAYYLPGYEGPAEPQRARLPRVV